MDTTLTKSQVTRLAKGISYKSLQTFYANPANQAEFEKWKKERKETNHEIDRNDERKSMQAAVCTS